MADLQRVRVEDDVRARYLPPRSASGTPVAVLGELLGSLQGVRRGLPRQRYLFPSRSRSTERHVHPGACPARDRLCAQRVLTGGAEALLGVVVVVDRPLGRATPLGMRSGEVDVRKRPVERITLVGPPAQRQLMMTDDLSEVRSAALGVAPAR